MQLPSWPQQQSAHLGKIRLESCTSWITLLVWVYTRYIQCIAQGEGYSWYIFWLVKLTWDKHSKPQTRLFALCISMLVSLYESDICGITSSWITLLVWVYTRYIQCIAQGEGYSWYIFWLVKLTWDKHSKPQTRLFALCISMLVSLYESDICGITSRSLSRAQFTR